MDFSEKRIAIVADWLIDFGWAELVISHLLKIFPQADIYTSVCYMQHPMLEWRKVYTSWLQKIPFFNRRHKLAGILRPWAFRSFDLSGYDVIISSSSAEAKNAGFRNQTQSISSLKQKGNKTPIHICYCHTPIRYYWSHFEEYKNMMEFGILNPLAKIILNILIGWLRKMDYEAAQNVDSFLANSENTRERIKQYYNRESTVIYPWVDTKRISESVLLKKSRTVSWSQSSSADFGDDTPNSKITASYYISIGRCIPYKKFDLLVDTFNKNGGNLVLVTNTNNSLFRELQEKSKPNITWKLSISQDEKNILLAWARGFLFPPEEDFGLVPIEAMALGIPVIAYGRWWALETVIDRKTGIFFPEQSVSSLSSAIESFESLTFDTNTIQEHAKTFDKMIFEEKIIDFVRSALQ